MFGRGNCTGQSLAIWRNVVMYLRKLGKILAEVTGKGITYKCELVISRITTKKWQISTQWTLKKAYTWAQLRLVNGMRLKFNVHSILEIRDDIQYFFLEICMMLPIPDNWGKNFKIYRSICCKISPKQIFPCIRSAGFGTDDR